MLEICLPMLAPTKADNELWNSDPNEFIRKEADLQMSLISNKNVACDLIEAICKKKDP